MISARWRSAGRTDPGKVRERNEDAFLERPEHGLWVVADGMGGHQAGHLASQMIVQSLAELILQGTFEEQLGEVRRCLHWLNARMGQTATVVAGCAPTIMGSTVVALLICDQRAACVWAGDSRCYLWRDNRLFQLSRDHSLREQLIHEQQLTDEQLKAHANVHALTRAVGGNEPLRLEILELEVEPGDTFLLCSDGLHGSLSEASLGKALRQQQPSSVLDCLFASVLAGRAADNLTGVVIGP